MLIKIISLLLQTVTLLALFLQPIICSTAEFFPELKHSTATRTRSNLKTEALESNSDIICGIFVCDLPNKTGLILFNNTEKSSEIELQRVAVNVVKKTNDAQPQAKSGIGDFTCLDGQGQARQKSYCNNVANYPTHSTLETMIKRQFTDFEKLLDQDILWPIEIGQRGGHEQEKGDQYLCDTYQGTIFPKSGTTKNNVWMLIVNDEANYKQGVRTEECVNVDKPCNLVDKPKDYTVTCKQHYRYHTLWAIKDNMTIAQEQFQIPCCCQCMYKPNSNILNVSDKKG